MRLLVRDAGRLVGILESTSDRGVMFRYDGDYLAWSEARPLSLSLPLRDSPFSQAATMPFFSGLLPDGEVRRKVADYLHVSPSSTLKLLDALGGDCAGTVSIVNEETAGQGRTDAPGGGRAAYKELSRDELAALVMESERRPLLAPRDGARLSLAGAQDKIPLRYAEGRWFLPLGEAPSSHILKPASRAFEDLVFNEFFCMRFAASLGFTVPAVDIVDAGRKTLLVKRYDRETDGEGRLTRIHQEDFCQALGIMPDKKYEADGGPSFAAIAATIRKGGADPLRDIAAFVRMALFNLLIGNCDAHGKNFSLLYLGRRIALAPFYDLVCTTVYPELANSYSMRFGGAYLFKDLGPAQVERFAAEVGVRPKFVKDTLSELIDTAAATREEVASAAELADAQPLVRSILEGWDARFRALASGGV